MRDFGLVEGLVSIVNRLDLCRPQLHSSRDSQGFPL
jgi:hypothetical protein